MTCDWDCWRRDELDGDCCVADDVAAADDVDERLPRRLPVVVGVPVGVSAASADAMAVSDTAPARPDRQAQPGGSGEKSICQ